MRDKGNNLRRRKNMKKKRNKPLSQKKELNTLERKTTKTECFKREEEKIEVFYKDIGREIRLDTNSSESFYKSLNSLVVITALYSSQKTEIIFIALSFYLLMICFSNSNKLK